MQSYNFSVKAIFSSIQPSARLFSLSNFFLKMLISSSDLASCLSKKERFFWRSLREASKCVSLYMIILNRFCRSSGKFSISTNYTKELLLSRMKSNKLDAGVDIPSDNSKLGRVLFRSKFTKNCRNNASISIMEFGNRIIDLCLFITFHRREIDWSSTFQHRFAKAS